VIFLFFARIVIAVCVFALFISVAVNFTRAKQNAEVEKSKKSIVETGTMTMFFVVFLLALKSNVLLAIPQVEIGRTVMSLIGALIVVVGCAVNILGRFRLGDNWSNQIKIYKDHTLITTGVYAIVRHPLYASIIWMFYGASVTYFNVLAFLAVTVIFVPFMYYRAKQEEEMLSERFPSYKEYRKKVGMFFPKILGGAEK